MRSSVKLAGLGLLAAVSASLCCIAPLLALLAGMGGLASSFSWLNEYRPYLIGFTGFALGLAWYQHFTKNNLKSDCNCNDEDPSRCQTAKKSFWRSGKFLIMVTILAGFTLALPFFSKAIQYPHNTSSLNINPLHIQVVEFSVEGMTCSGCENHITKALTKMDGVAKAVVSYNYGHAIVDFDTSIVTIQQMTKAIHDAGYSVTKQKMLP